MKLYKALIYKQYLLPKQRILEIFNRGVVYRRQPGVDSSKTPFSGANFQIFLHYEVVYKP